MKYSEKDAVKIIVKAAKEYAEKLANNRFLILYQSEKGIVSTQIEFRDNHFWHLTGVKTKLSAQRFYDKCLDGKLSCRDFELDGKANSQRKISILPFLADLLYNNCMIGTFINSGIYIKADYFVGNTKAILKQKFSDRFYKEFTYISKGVNTKKLLSINIINSLVAIDDEQEDT